MFSTVRENCCAPTKSASDASPFWAIVRDFFSFSILHPSTKGHRDLELRRLGVILDGESDFRGFIYFFIKNEKLRFRNFRRSTEVGFLAFCFFGVFLKKYDTYKKTS